MTLTDTRTLFAKGMEDLQRGDFAAARQAFEAVVKAAPETPETLSALSFALANLGEAGQARALSDKAAALAPENPQVLMHKAFAEDQAGDKAAAIATLQAAAKAAPNQPPVLVQLSRLLVEAGRLEDALIPLKGLYALQPAAAEKRLKAVLETLLARARENEDWPRALQFARTLEDLAPDDIEAKRAVVLALMMLEDYAESLKVIKEIFALDPNNKKVLYSMAFTLFNLNRHEECLPFVEKVLKDIPDHVDALLVKGQTLFLFNELEKAEAIFRRVLELAPGHTLALLQLAKVKSPKPGDETYQELVALDKATGKDDPFKPLMGYTFGEIFERAGDYDKAFHYFTIGNKMAGDIYAKRGFPFDKAKIEADFARLEAIYSKDNLARLEGAGSDSNRPIFIVAMPRSGTTLLEQVISSHSDVFGGGELSYATSLSVMLYNETGDGSPEKAAAVLQKKAKEYAQFYLDYLPGDGDKFARVTDKMPYNFKQLGLLQTILPNAAFIHIKRNPLDICLSMYKGFFNKGFTYAHDLKNLGFYYRKYFELMEYWRGVLPRPLLEIQYEEFVADPETLAPEVLEFCGLDWQPQCLEFYKNKNKVTTMSTQQVRQPIHAGSVEKWRRYEKYIEPLLEGLGPDIVATLKL